MLRPNVVIEYAKERGKIGRSDFDQLLNGVNVGGRIVVGGQPQVAAHLRSIAVAQHRLGTVLSITEILEPRLDPFLTYSFDTMTVAQLLMIAKNEAFHNTVTQAIEVIRQTTDDGKSVAEAMQLLREQADQIGVL